MLKTSFKIILIFLLANGLQNCQAQKTSSMPEKHSNALINETSPYLLQHAHNPVNWMPWGEEALEKAKKENKLLIISIGYSACHWCHVMERESFEDSSAAALMNEHFIPIKIDREERPDVDQIYMTAVQLMTGRGGWPLNIVALPDGRPVWGGTYFPKENWMQALQGIYEVYRDEPEKMLEYAEKLTSGVVQSELVVLNNEEPNFQKEQAEEIIANWSPSFDSENGGPNRAPKFPLPNNYEYLLHYGHLKNDKAVLDQVQLTLRKMAYGGIYDQIGGGFSRYSTDEIWKVPHFEKMLYDNAQLVSLYSHAYQQFKNPLYKETVYQTIEWLDREMTGPDGEFYSALDADSEGEEGKFYVWKKEELQNIIAKNEWDLFDSYFHIDRLGLWEHGNYILMRKDGKPEISPDVIKNWNDLLLKERSKRIRPGLDDKSLTSWNAMMITGLIDAYSTFEDENFLKAAVKNAKWLKKHQKQKDGSLLHSYKKGESKIGGLIEDYSLSIQAFIKLFEATGKEEYLRDAENWMVFCQQNFKDKASQLFYTRNLKSEQLIAKSLETSDNVIPAANSIMAMNLFLLSHYLDKSNYSFQAQKMMNHVAERMYSSGENYSNWAKIHLHLSHPFFEIAISGSESKSKYLEFNHNYHPNVLWIFSEKDSSIPLLENRFLKGETKIYVCENSVCQLPQNEVKKAEKLILKE